MVPPPPKKDGQVFRRVQTAEHLGISWGVESFIGLFGLNDVRGELKSPHLFVPSQVESRSQQTFASPDIFLGSGTRMQHLSCKVGTGKPKKASL